MTDRQMATTEELVAEYVRASMGVQPPPSLAAEVMRAVGSMPQERRGWLSAFGPYTPAMAALAAVALILAIGAVISAPRNVGPPTDPTAPPTPTPAPTITPEDARVLTEPGDVVVIPALDSEGQFGTITIERGEEVAAYPDFRPLAADLMAEEVFFIELHVRYDIHRPTDAGYGSAVFGWAVDGDGDGLDADDRIWQYFGAYDVDGQLLETGPRPMLPDWVAGSQDASGWLALELMAPAADFDVYLVKFAAVDAPPPAAFPGFDVEGFALLRTPADPVGLSGPPSPAPGAGETPPLNVQRLPTPAPEPMPTFEPPPDPAADELLADPETCYNDELAATIAFPRGWHTNEAFEDVPACTWFDSEPFDTELVYYGFSERFPVISFTVAPGWYGYPIDQPGVPEAQLARVPINGRLAWKVTFERLPTEYLIPMTDDPYGPFVRADTGDEPSVVERMLLLLTFDDGSS